MAIQTTSILKRSALFRAGELTDGTSPYDSKALEYMNQIYRAVLSGGNEFDLEFGIVWSWARARQPATLVLQPKVTGFVDVTNGSSAISFFTPDPGNPGQWLPLPISPSMRGQWFKVVGRTEVFRVSAHTSGDDFASIDALYTEDTGAKLPFEIYIVEYDLPVQIERLTAPMVVSRQQNFEAPEDGLIYQVDPVNMDQNFPMKFLSEDVPQQFAQVSRDEFGNIRVRFSSSVGIQTRVAFDYIPLYSPLYEAILENGTSAINVSTNTITTPRPHGLINGTKVVFDVMNSSTLPSGLSLERIYYVVNATTSTLQVSLTEGGAVVALGTVGLGDISISNIPIIPDSFSNVLEYGASAYLMIDKNDDRAESLAALTKSKMAAMIAANSREMSQASGGRMGQMIPRMDMYSGPRRYWRQSVTP